MRIPLRRYVIGSLAVGLVAGAAAFALPGTTADWHPVTSGLTATPAQLLPAHVSSAAPVRVVSTTVDSKGRPVVKAVTATDKTSASTLIRKAQKAKGAVSVELDAVATALDVSDGSDPYRAQQWDLTKIHDSAAWATSTGAGVTVAVIDTGVDASHPDLAGQVLPGIDYVSDTSGTSTDPNGHGTHVAGTIAALTGNGVGVSGFAPDAKILPIRVLGANGSGSMSDAAQGIIYAADHGANVINMSLGSTSKVTAVTNAIAYARSKGVTVVAAAGNERSSGSPISYPAADAGVIAVAATDSSDTVASYSNQGSYVDVAAPGSSIVSTVPNGKYAVYNGTSMASPHVAAVAALLEAYNPALTPDAIESALESTAVDLGATGKDTDYGYGRIDAVAALNAVKPATSAPVTTAPSTGPTSASPSPVMTTTAAPTPSKTTTPTPSKTTTAPKVTPAIKTTAGSTSLVYGTNATVTYTVTTAGKAYAGKTVRIGTATPGGAFTWTEATTGSTGVVSFSRAATGHLQVKLLVPGTATTVETTSTTTSFTVRAQVAVTSPAKGTIKVALTGAAGQTVQVQRYEKSRWTTVTTYPAAAQVTLTGATSGSQFRVVVPSTSTLTGVTSATVKVL
jgi:serine protease